VSPDRSPDPSHAAASGTLMYMVNSYVLSPRSY
jgi:hypothetical protein